MASPRHSKSRWNHYIITLYYMSTSFLHCPFLDITIQGDISTRKTETCLNMTLKANTWRMACPAQVRLLVIKYLHRFLPWSHSLLKPHWWLNRWLEPLLFGQSADWPEWCWRNVYDGCPGTGGGREPSVCWTCWVQWWTRWLAIWTGDRDGCYDSSGVREFVDLGKNCGTS